MRLLYLKFGVMDAKAVWYCMAGNFGGNYIARFHEKKSLLFAELVLRYDRVHRVTPPAELPLLLWKQSHLLFFFHLG